VLPLQQPAAQFPAPQLGGGGGVGGGVGVGAKQLPLMHRDPALHAAQVMPSMPHRPSF
jgi:hypothetical protein